MGRPESEVYQLRPLLDLRAKIQRLNLALVKILQHGSNKEYLGKDISGDKFFFDTLEDLISSNFSLWRAAFLIYLGNSREHRAEAMRKMLHGLLEDNSFVFTHEVASQAWLGPYYIDHSKLRINNRIAAIRARAIADDWSPLDQIWKDHRPHEKKHLKPGPPPQRADGASSRVDPSHFIFLFNELSRQFNSQLQILDFAKWYAAHKTNGEVGWPPLDDIGGAQLVEIED